MLYNDSDRERRISIDGSNALGKEEAYRTAFRRDYSRLVHTSAFRRLQGKTQIFGISETDFFRNRLTHSIEVADIACSIALYLNHHSDFIKDIEPIDLDLISFAGLAHDIGHPPFGHYGERVLNELLIKNGGFEGNAQTLRILGRLEKKLEHFPEEAMIASKQIDNTKKRCGLNLTARSLASILKYDTKLSDGTKGYYAEEEDLVYWIKECVCGDKYQEKFRTLECSIMDCADDIAYSCHDLEDAFKVGLLSLGDLVSQGKEIYEAVAEKVSNTLDETITGPEISLSIIEFLENVVDIKTIISDDDIEPEMRHIEHYNSFKNVFKEIARNGYHRSSFASKFVCLCIRNISIEEGRIPALSSIRIPKDALVLIESIKNLVFEIIVKMPAFRVTEYRGEGIIKQLFKTFSDHPELMPHDYSLIQKNLSCDSDKNRLICDFIAGMTDRHAIEIHKRLFGTSEHGVFKPVL